MSDLNLRRKIIAAAFRMPSVQTMVSRKSSITNAFVNAVIPVVEPTIEEIDEALRILEMTPEDVRCAYCGDKATEWDHLRPLVLNKRPTGFISEIANLVPSCGKCNQSKRNEKWQTWILSQKARHSPTKRNIDGTAKRIQLLEAYERWRQPVQIDFTQILGEEQWSGYWRMWDSVNEELRRCQAVADKLREKVARALRTNAK